MNQSTSRFFKTSALGFLKASSACMGAGIGFLSGPVVAKCALDFAVPIVLQALFGAPVGFFAKQSFNFISTTVVCNALPVVVPVARTVCIGVGTVIGSKTYEVAEASVSAVVHAGCTASLTLMKFAQSFRS